MFIGSLWETPPRGQIVWEKKSLFVVTSERTFFFSLSCNSVPQHVKCTVSPSGGTRAPPETKAKSSPPPVRRHLAPRNCWLLDFEEPEEDYFKGAPAPHLSSSDHPAPSWCLQSPDPEPSGFQPHLMSLEDLSRDGSTLAALSFHLTPQSPRGSVPRAVCPDPSSVLTPRPPAGTWARGRRLRPSVTVTQENCRQSSPVPLGENTGRFPALALNLWVTS